MGVFLKKLIANTQSTIDNLVQTDIRTVEKQNPYRNPISSSNEFATAIYARACQIENSVNPHYAAIRLAEYELLMALWENYGTSAMDAGILRNFELNNVPMLQEVKLKDLAYVFSDEHNIRSYEDAARFINLLPDNIKFFVKNEMQHTTYVIYKCKNEAFMCELDENGKEINHKSCHAKGIWELRRWINNQLKA